MAEITRKRSGELVRGAFAILLEHPDGLQAKLVLAELAKRVPPTPFEATFYEDRPTIRRYEKIVRFSTIGPVKAGWLEKNKGLWFVTDAGRAAYTQFPWVQDQPARTDEQAEEAQEQEAGTSALFEEAEESAWSEIEQHLGRMHPYDFQKLVAGLLRGMGYFVAWVAPPGPDMGVDILAHSDPLGINGPRIKVQVKRQADKTSVTGVRSFLSELVKRPFTSSDHFVRGGRSPSPRPRSDLAGGWVGGETRAGARETKAGEGGWGGGNAVDQAVSCVPAIRGLHPTHAPRRGRRGTLRACVFSQALSAR